MVLLYEIGGKNVVFDFQWKQGNEYLEISVQPSKIKGDFGYLIMTELQLKLSCLIGYIELGHIFNERSVYEIFGVTRK